MPARKPEQAPSYSVGIVLVAVAAAAPAGWFGLPALAVVWLGVLLAAWTHPAVVLTGRKDRKTGEPTPAGERELSRLRSRRFWVQLRWRPVVANPDWFPGWPPRIIWLIAVAAASVAALLPVVWWWFRPVNAAGIFLVIVAVADARRRTMVEADVCPGVRISTIGKIKTHPLVTGGLVAAAAAAGGAAWVTSTYVDPVWLARPAQLVDGLAVDPAGELVTVAAAAGSVGVLAGLVVLWLVWQQPGLAHWRTVVARREQWQPRWEALKYDPAPQLLDTQKVGSATVDTFAAPAGKGAAAFYHAKDKIAPTIGGGETLAVLDVPDTDDNAEILPGARHPVLFRIVQWRSGQLPDLTDTDLCAAEARLAAERQVISHLDRDGYARPCLTDIQPVHADTSPTAIWQTRWVWPDGPGWDYLHQQGVDVAEDAAGDALIDADGDQLYLGGPASDGAAFADAASAARCEQILTENYWRDVWTNVVNAGEVPDIQHDHVDQLPFGVEPGWWADLSDEQRAEHDDRTVVTVATFLTRKGQPAQSLFGLEPKLATSMSSTPFLAMAGFCPRGDGARHPQAVQLAYAPKVMPGTPSQIPACAAAQPVLAGLINAAFDAARLVRPELIDVAALTRPDAPETLWQVRLRLYGGVTMGQVRDKAAKVATTLQTEWLRVTEDGDTCVLYAGCPPAVAQLARPDHDELRLTGLDWEQAWVDAKVAGSAERSPTLVSVDQLEHNPQVQVLDFKLPAGVDPQAVKAACGKLSVATGNEFVAARPSGDPTTARLLVSDVDPLPTSVALDPQLVGDPHPGTVPFAVGVEGEPVAFDVVADSHLLVVGQKGSGKTVTMRGLLAGGLRQHMRCVVIDPVKFAADFMFAADYVDAFATDAQQAAAVLKAVYADIQRRKRLNAQYQVGSYRELPADVRPPHIMVLIDEFTSLIGQDPVPQASDDPTVDEEREQAIATHAAKTAVGVYAGKFAGEARSTGISLILGTQKLTSKMLEKMPRGSDLRTNLARLLLGKASPGDRMAALTAPDDAPALGDAVPAGRGVWEPSTEGVRIVQTWVSSQSQLAELLDGHVPKTVDRDDQLVDPELLNPAATAPPAARQASTPSTSSSNGHSPPKQGLMDETVHHPDDDGEVPQMEVTLDELFAAEQTDTH